MYYRDGVPRIILSQEKHENVKEKEQKTAL